MAQRITLLLLSLIYSSLVWGQLEIQVTRGIDNPTSIAIAPFAWDGLGTSPVDFSQIIDSDLARSGQFSPVSRRDMLSLPTSKEDIFYRDWRAIATRYLVIGRVSKGTQLRVDFALHDVERGIELFTGQVVGSESEARMVAHGVADAIYEKLTGIPGAFATRLIYVSVTRNPRGQRLLSVDCC
jgi:TolB protein